MAGIDEPELDSLFQEAPEEMVNSQKMPGPARKRVYQPRRKNRACDACRARKTKCDEPVIGVCGPCTSCASASLLCRFTESEDGKKRIGPVRRLRILETTIEELTEKLRVAEAKLQSPTMPLTPDHSLCDRSPRSPTPQQPWKFSSGRSSKVLFPGSTSTLGFMESVQGYMDGLGYDTSLLDARGPNEGKSQSANTSSYGETLQIRDLRALLPTKENGEKLLAIFYQHLARYMPAMSWSVICDKFERAYEVPIFADDRSSVTGIFCVLMTINAYASICSDDADVFEVPNYSSKRGWYFLEFAKNFHNLHQPTHSLFDVEVLVAMALYLEVVALPYPLRLTVEYLAKVCKDLELHRKPAYTHGKFSLQPSELEHRSRLFWCTFLLDQKLALQFGTTPIFDENEVDIDKPGSSEVEDLVDKESKTITLEEPGSIVLMESLIATSRFIGPISRLNPQMGNAEPRMNYIEQQLDDVERHFPQNILTWESSTPLDPVLLDAAMFAMATRLSLYRYFTDATLGSEFRARCFIQCLEVAKVTVHLLRRTMKFPEWEKSFRLRQCGLTYQHIFKVSTILLLSTSIFPKPLDMSSELRTCIGVLQLAAPVRPPVLQSLQILDKLSEILKQKPASEWRGPNPSCSTTIPQMESLVGHRLGMTYSSTGVPVTATFPSTAPGMMSHDHITGWSNVPMTIPPINDVLFYANSASPIGPDYKFPSLTALDPVTETDIWLDQVDPSSWALMQSAIQKGELR
ncbi:hypothetical protein TWF281_008681 [Arthrobotrys megalospora]